MKGVKEITSTTLGYAFAAYMYTMIVAVPWFNWNYARENGFMKWLLLGEFVATTKAIVWPYYAYAKFANDDDWKEDWEKNTEMLAYTITGSWTAIREPEVAKQLPDMISYQKKWVSNLPEYKQQELRNAAIEFEMAWIKFGNLIIKSPESLFDSSIFNSPSIEAHVNQFKHISGLRNAWDRTMQNHAVVLAKFKAKADISEASKERTAEMLKAMSSVFAMLSEQGKERMDETIVEIFGQD